AKAETLENLGMSEAIVQRLFDQFFTTGEKSIAKLADAIEREDLDQIEMEAHNLKGVALTLHLPILVEPAKLIESKALRRESFDYAHTFKILKGHFKELQMTYNAEKERSS
ncbi:MAG: Hpt domain-containing protein, partial [Sulfurimonadaceae bacterium]|nr:Hpt domain-containing protein [Sulfurimonadaceae bacterium]